MYRPSAPSIPKPLIDVDEMNKKYIKDSIENCSKSDNSLNQLRKERLLNNKAKKMYYRQRQKEVLDEIKQIILSNLPTYHDVKNYIRTNPSHKKFIIFESKFHSNYIGFWNSTIRYNCIRDINDDIYIKICTSLMKHGDYAYNRDIDLTNYQVSDYYIYSILRNVNIKGLGKVKSSCSLLFNTLKIYYPL